MTEDEIEYLIEKWHNGDFSCELHEFLGWTEPQYAKWVETDDVRRNEEQ